MGFPNKAGDHEDTDGILTEELHAAGIQTCEEAEGHFSDSMKAFFRKSSGEVKTSVFGILHGWQFKRNWYYWVCTGPGIPVEEAEELNNRLGEVVRVDGFAGGLDPREHFKGLACGAYHVDTPEGLKALADVIKGLVEKSEKILSERKAAQT